MIILKLQNNNKRNHILSKNERMNSKNIKNINFKKRMKDNTQEEIEIAK